MPDSNTHLSPAHLLKGAALLFAGLGVAFLVWVTEKWIKYPEMRASQFGFEAPLWPALGVFVLLAISTVGTLFWRAARRVESGEDLFAQRHRRRKGERQETSNGQFS